MKHAKMTYTYKLINQYELKVDVYLTNQKKNSPGILWLHGGGLIMGDRQMINQRQLEIYLQEGFTVVSPDYRLAPEAKVESIIEDVEDAFYWLKNNANDFGIDANQIGLVGHSAGSYLALLLCTRTIRLPKALILFYGYGDILADWANRPNLYYCEEGLITKEQAYQNINTDGKIISSNGTRLQFYLYCRQRGIWAKEIIGKEIKNIEKTKKYYCPTYNISEKFPPTLLLHGDEDIDVPISESVKLANNLKAAGVQHELVKYTGYGHYFDNYKDAFEDEKIVQGFRKVMEFLKKN